MANKKKFTAPQENPYTGLIQSAEAAAPAKREVYRFNLVMPMECKDYLAEMAWRKRTTITDYLTNLITADMAAHPEWKDTIDILNK